MTKTDVYQEVTDRIVAALEHGTVPWRKPWRDVATGGPVNIRNGRAYRGVNVFLLALAGYSDPRWGTFRAIKEAGGNVRKGEKGTRIILWKPVKSRAESTDDTERRDYLLLREYVVFNAEQCDGLPEYEREELPEHARLERAETVADAYTNVPGPAVMYGGNAASYSPWKDIVRMPELGQFGSADEYYSTLFHELVHSTGHESRLGRLEPALFGTDPYAREELVAEMGAAMLCGLVGIESTGDNSAAYVANWLQRLKDDRKLVVQAAAAAQKAADLILGDTFAQDEETEESGALAAAAA